MTLAIGLLIFAVVAFAFSVLALLVAVTAAVLDHFGWMQ